MSYEVQLKWIQSLQEVLRNPITDAFFKALHYFDSSYFVYVAMTLVWYLWKKRLGIKFFYIMVFSLVCNQLLKMYFNHPRPSQIDPLIGLYHLYSPGLPSGAAQSATIYFGFVFLECKKFWPRVFVAIFAFLLCFSRIYLGVHFITDVLGGIAVGCILLAVYHYIFTAFENQWKFLCLVFPFPLLLGPLFKPELSHFFYMTFFAALGVGIGLSAKRPVHDTLFWKVKILRVVSVLTGLVALSAIGIFYPAVRSLTCFAQGYWLSYLGAKLIPDKKI